MVILGLGILPFETKYESWLLLQSVSFLQLVLTHYLSTTSVNLVEKKTASPPPLLSVHSYDPAHSIVVKQILHNVLGWISYDSDLDDNRIHHVTSADERILFVMPHCDRILYARIIEENQHVLHQICIIGNSFHGYVIRSPDIEDSICKLMTSNNNNSSDSNVKEIPLRVTFPTLEQGVIEQQCIERAFNDTVLITFSSSSSPYS
jgi:hypothetical protein